MDLVIDAHGQIRCVYGEELDLSLLGKLSISRASHVEPDAEGCWWADLSPVGGPALGPFRKRTQALAAEQTWLKDHWLEELPFNPIKENRHEHAEG